jgi:ADP-heptose:LPS heptosyltransferase
VQKGPGTEQLAAVTERFSLPDLGSRFHTFQDTAAALENLDLVITVDSAVAHCAGALATPAWVLIPYAADWRWLLERADSPWYPTMRLFRQQEPGNWEEVFDRLLVELTELVAQEASPAPKRAKSSSARKGRVP